MICVVSENFPLLYANKYRQINELERRDKKKLIVNCRKNILWKARIERWIMCLFNEKHILGDIFEQN